MFFEVSRCNFDILFRLFEIEVMREKNQRYDKSQIRFKTGLKELPQELINKSWPKRLKIYRNKNLYRKKLLQIINKKKVIKNRKCS